MRKLLIPIMLIMTAYLAGCSGDNGNGPVPPPVKPPRLVADSTVAAPDMNNADDPVWNSVDSVNIEIGGSPTLYGYDSKLGKINVNMKAIRKDGNLFIKARWRDGSPNLLGNHIRKSDTAVTIDWEHNIYEGEDRFFILFDAGNNGTEKADCATMCHTPVMKTTGGGNADAWKWSSTRTFPGKMAEDEWWTSSASSEDAYLTGTTLWVYTNNWNPTTDAPAKMHHDTTDFDDPFLFVDDAVNMDRTGPPWPTGFRMPGYVIDTTIYKSADRTNKSKWDVRAIGKQDSTTVPYQWIVVFSRALNTTHNDDVNLAGLDSVQVTIAGANNYTLDYSNQQHSGSKPFYIILKP